MGQQLQACDPERSLAFPAIGVEHACQLSAQGERDQDAWAAGDSAEAAAERRGFVGAQGHGTRLFGDPRPDAAFAIVQMRLFDLREALPRPAANLARARQEKRRARGESPTFLEQGRQDAALGGLGVDARRRGEQLSDGLVLGRRGEIVKIPHHLLDRRSDMTIHLLQTIEPLGTVPLRSRPLRCFRRLRHLTILQEAPILISGPPISPDEDLDYFSTRASCQGATGIAKPLTDGHLAGSLDPFCGASDACRLTDDVLG